MSDSGTSFSLLFVRSKEAREAMEDISGGMDSRLLLARLKLVTLDRKPTPPGSVFSLLWARSRLTSRLRSAILSSRASIWLLEAARLCSSSRS